MKSRYKYSSRIAKSILKITDEIPTKHEKYDKLKRKGTKYSNKSDRKNHNVIREKVYEMFQKGEAPRNPSRTQYQITFEELEEMKMIKKEPTKEFSTTEMGHLCNKYDHDPKSYQKFYFVWAIICFRAENRENRWNRWKRSTIN